MIIWRETSGLGCGRGQPELSVAARTLLVMDPTHSASWVDQLDTIAVDTLDTVLREIGMVQPPTVHLLLDGLNPAYLGYLTCRAFYRGSDAAAAVAMMGLAGSMLTATRLVITWENADMCTAFQTLDPDESPTGVVVVDADQHSHTMRWHPMRMHAGPVTREGAHTVLTEWGASQMYRDGRLPEPVADLLTVWRTPRTWADTDMIKTYVSMDTGGYSMRWIQRRPEEPFKPAWMELLAPVM